MKSLSRSLGWTLLEMLIVLVIVGIVVGAVVWRMHAWESSSERVRLVTVSQTWKHMRMLALERSTRMSCDLSSKGWACSQWVASLSGEMHWVQLRGFPWQSKNIWPKSWHWPKQMSTSFKITIYPDGQVSPNPLSLCDDRDRCWLLWKGVMVES